MDMLSDTSARDPEPTPQRIDRREAAPINDKGRRMSAPALAMLDF
jgi:hypothetical protein